MQASNSVDHTAQEQATVEPAASLPEASAAEPLPTATDSADQVLPQAEAASAAYRPSRHLLKWTLVLFNGVMALFLLKWAEIFFIPFVAGIFLSYTLGPLVDRLEKMKVPRALGSAVAVLAFVGMMGGIGYAVWYQAVDLADSLPATIARVNKSLKEVRNSKGSAISKISEAAKAVDGAMQAPPVGKAAPPSQPPAAPLPNLAPNTSAAVLVEKSIAVFGGLGTLGSVLLLAYFLLAAGRQFRRKMVKVVGDKWSQKRGLVEMLDDVHASLQRYLGSLFITNALLGLATYVLLRVQGFENAGVWGVLAGVLHVIPFLGTLIAGLGVLITGLQQWTDLTPALAAAGSTVLVATLIGTIAQTWIFGRIANINHTAQFVALLFFAWLWGSLGLLIAIPMLVVIKVITNRMEGFEVIAEFLRDGDEAPTPEKATSEASK